MIRWTSGMWCPKGSWSRGWESLLSKHNLIALSPWIPGSVDLRSELTMYIVYNRFPGIKGIWKRKEMGQSTWQTGWIRLLCSWWCEQPGTPPAGTSAVLIHHPCGLPDGVWPTHRAREQVQVIHYSTAGPPTFSVVFPYYSFPSPSSPESILKMGH